MLLTPLDYTICGVHHGSKTLPAGLVAPRQLSGEARTMHIARRFTTAGRDPYDAVAFRTATSEIRNPDGSVVFASEGIEVPAEWSQVACDILAQKYLRKAGVPARVAAIEEEGVPSWLWRRAADEAALAVLPKGERTIG